MQIEKIDEHKMYSVKLTAKEDNAILGWAILCIIYNDQHEEPYGLMENVYVEIEHRGKGIGTQLVEALVSEAKARGCYKLIFTTRHTKPQVQEWYKTLGFVDWGTEFRLDF